MMIAAWLRFLQTTVIQHVRYSKQQRKIAWLFGVGRAFCLSHNNNNNDNDDNDNDNDHNNNIQIPMKNRRFPMSDEAVAHMACFIIIILFMSATELTMDGGN
jgi:hypothetical protein